MYQHKLRIVTRYSSLKSAKRNSGEREISDAPRVRIRRRPRSVSRARHRHEIVGEHCQCLKKRRQHRVTGDDQTGAENEQRHAFVDENHQRIGQNALECRSTLLDAGDDAAEARFGEHDARGRFGDVRRRRHCDAQLRLPQCRRVIGAVAAHAGGMALLLKSPDQAVLLFRQDSGIDGKIVRTDAVGNVSRRADRPVQSNCMCNRRSRCRSVAADHHRQYAERAQFTQQLRRIRPRRVAKGDKSDQIQRTRGTGGHGQRPVSGVVQRIQIGRRRYADRRERHDHCGRALDDADFMAANDDPCLGHFCCRIERFEARGGKRRASRAFVFDQHPADGGIDRILTIRRARERGKTDHIRRVVACFCRANRAYRQLVQGQRAGLVTAQHIDGGRLVQCRQSREQDAIQRQRPGAQRRSKSECCRQGHRHRRQHRGEDQERDLLNADADK